jgi:RNA polymerase sigma factor (sigma-70 family)
MCLINRLIELRNNIASLPKDSPLLKTKKSELSKHETVCVEKFKYIINQKCSKYRAYSNFDDLNQDGLEALTKAMKNYDPAKGSVFWWIHKYVDTKISRSANLHTTIRYPLKVARIFTPHKESVMPILIEMNNVPDKQYEKSTLLNSIENSIMQLSDRQQEIVERYFGIKSTKTESLTKISRQVIEQELNDALAKLKRTIKN